MFAEETFTRQFQLSIFYKIMIENETMYEYMISLKIYIYQIFEDEMIYHYTYFPYSFLVRDNHSWKHFSGFPFKTKVIRGL